MPELIKQFPLNNENEAEYEEDEIDEKLLAAAREYGLFDRLPEIGKPAYKYLKELSLSYAHAVDRQCTSEIVKNNPFAMTKSDEARRKLHDSLCRKIFGTTWELTDGINRHQISDFACKTAGFDQYVGTF